MNEELKPTTASDLVEWMEEALQFVCCTSWSSSHFVRGKDLIAQYKTTNPLPLIDPSMLEVRG